MSDGESQIRWPEKHQPEGASWLAVNELQMEAEPERVWTWLTRPDLWPSYYSNARVVRRLDGAWPEISMGSRFRWITFGVPIASEVVEFEPPHRLAWSAKGLGSRGHHAWVFQARAGGTFVHTEETQRGWATKLSAPVMRRWQTSQHQRWLEGLARVSAEGPPPPP